MTKAQYLIRLLVAGVVSIVTLTDSNSEATPIQFTPAAPLTSYWNVDDGTDYEIEPKMASDGAGRWVVTWTTHRKSSALPKGIYASVSSDNGISWSTPVTISTGDVGQQDIYYTGSEWVIISAQHYPDGPYSMVRTYARHSIDGLAWSEPELVPVSSNNYLKTDHNSSGTLLGVFDFTRIRSTDGGKTWTSSMVADRENYNSISASSQVAYAGNGKWYHLVFASYGETHDFVMHLYTSTDNGATWSTPVNVNSAFSQYQDFAAHGNIIVALNFPFIHVSTDGGQTWTGNRPQYNLADPPPQDLAVDNNGNWILTAQVAAQTPGVSAIDYNVVIRRTSSPAASWSTTQTVAAEPLQREMMPAIAPDGNGGFMLGYQADFLKTIRPGPDFDLKVHTTTDAGATWSSATYISATHATDFPQISDRAVQIVNGDAGAVVAVWAAVTDYEFGTDHIMFARSSDYGATWTHSAPVTPPFTAGTNDIFDYKLIYVGTGRWFVHWSYQSDGYTLYSISEDNGFTWSTPGELASRHLAGNGQGTLIMYMGNQSLDGNHSIARLPFNSSTWEEPFMLPEPVDAYTLEKLGHSGGQNWYMTTWGEGNLVYTSTDDGRTWAAVSGVNIPRGARIDKDESGNLVASFMTAESGTDRRFIYASRSTNNAVTWSPPVLLAQRNYFSTGFGSSLANFTDIAHLGDNVWAIIWMFPVSNLQPARFEYCLSIDGGMTWTAPSTLPFEDLDLISTARITADNYRILLAWEQKTRIGESVSDETDIYYSFGVPGTVTAARDWQLFE